MDDRRFDDLTRILARTEAPSRRTLLRRLVGGMIGGLLMAGRVRPGSAQDACEPACPGGYACLNGKCESILAEEGCPVGCPSGFVCSGDRCVEEVTGACEGPCELVDEFGGCYFACPDDEVCLIYPPEAAGTTAKELGRRWWSVDCAPARIAARCFDCVGRNCTFRCGGDEYCLKGECVPCPNYCAGDVTCGRATTKGLCCQRPEWAVCVCESSPGAGDGFVGCCGGPDNPCPKLPGIDWVEDLGSVWHGSDASPRFAASSAGRCAVIGEATVSCDA